MDEETIRNMTDEEIIEGNMTFSVFGEPAVTVIEEMIKHYPGLISKIEKSQFPPESVMPSIWKSPTGEPVVFAVKMPLVLIPVFSERCCSPGQGSDTH